MYPLNRNPLKLLRISMDKPLKIGVPMYPKNPLHRKPKGFHLVL